VVERVESFPFATMHYHSARARSILKDRHCKEETHGARRWMHRLNGIAIPGMENRECGLKTRGCRQCDHAASMYAVQYSESGKSGLNYWLLAVKEGH
jgi:hypothetical protein